MPLIRYSVYRLNMHVNRELYDWRGANVNGRMSPQHPAFERVRFVRAIRQLERLRDHVPKANYSALLGASNCL